MRTATHKYAIYVDPAGEQPTEHEMYDLERDPDEAANLVGLRDGSALESGDRDAATELRELLRARSGAASSDRRAGPGSATG